MFLFCFGENLIFSSLSVTAARNSKSKPKGGFTVFLMLQHFKKVKVAVETKVLVGEKSTLTILKWKKVTFTKGEKKRRIP